MPGQGEPGSRDPASAGCLSENRLLCMNLQERQTTGGTVQVHPQPPPIRNVFAIGPCLARANRPQLADAFVWQVFCEMYKYTQVRTCVSPDAVHLPSGSFADLDRRTAARSRPGSAFVSLADSVSFAPWMARTGRLLPPALYDLGPDLSSGRNCLRILLPAPSFEPRDGRPAPGSTERRTRFVLFLFPLG